MIKIPFLEYLNDAIADDIEPEDILSERTAELARELLTPLAEYLDARDLHYVIYSFCRALYLEFMNIGSKRVQIIIGATGRSSCYLYHEGFPNGKDCEYGADLDMSPESLFWWLDWLQSPG